MHAAHLTSETLTSLCKGAEFAIFWQKVMENQSEIDVAEPTIPRRHKTPSRFEVGTEESHYPSSIEDHYKVQYFVTLDLLIACIKDRFNQPGYRVYSKLETLFLDAANGVALDEHCFSEVMDLYTFDFDSSLQVTATNSSNITSSICLNQFNSNFLLIYPNHSLSCQKL